MWVLPGLVFLRGSEVVSSQDIVSWADFESALLPAKIAKDTDAASRARPAPLGSRALLLAQHPWATQYLDDGMQILKKARVAGDHGPRGFDPDDQAEAEEEEPQVPLTEDQVEEVFDAMVEARAQVSEDYTGSFRVLPLGSLWTAQNKGKAQDNWCAKACTSSSNDWCKTCMGQQAPGLMWASMVQKEHWFVRDTGQPRQICTTLN